jgi:membrane dipeptidase
MKIVTFKAVSFAILAKPNPPYLIYMKSLFLCLIIFPLLVSSQSYKKIHRRAIVVDTHNDLISASIDKKLSIDQDLSGKTHSDLNRLKRAGIDVQLFSVWCDGLKLRPYEWANLEIDTLTAVANRNPGKIKIVGTPDELRQTIKEKKIAAMFGVEGGHMIEDKIDNLDSLYKRGVRYMTLTWNNSTSWATSAKDETTKKDSLTHKGLTEFGKQVVKRMNRLGMMVDLSHVGEQTFWDAINTTTKPVLVSHSDVYALCPVARNLKDEQIKAIAKNGGVIDVNFYSGFIDSNFEKRSDSFYIRHKAENDSLLKINPEPYFGHVFLFQKYPDEVISMRPPLSMLIDHIDYIVKLIGVDHVGIGSDFDGINSAPQHLDDVTDLPLVTKELNKRGYSKRDIYKILGGNFLRLFEANSAK